MEFVLKSLQTLFLELPDGVLQAWGLGAYLVGWVLLVVAYGNFTLRPGGRWGLGWRRQAWDDHALKGVLLTFVLVLVSGFLGSHIVLVPGAQTFESLKDLAVFVCLMVFGYPALLIVPVAYGLSDLVEGVPPEFLFSWLPGYWINPSCFWLGMLVLGKAPDFRTGATWGRYGVFVLAFLAVEPALWGWVAAGQFPGGISYYQITPALFFTTAITWVLAPLVLFFLLPWVRKHGWLWSLRPGSVREFDLTRTTWVWESGTVPGTPAPPGGGGIPIRLALALPVLLLLFATVGVTAFVGLATGIASSSRLAEQLHQEQSRTIALELDNWFEARPTGAATDLSGLDELLASASAAWKGRTYLLGSDGALLVGSPTTTPDLVLQAYRQTVGPTKPGTQSIDVVTAQPLSRETWMARTTAYHNDRGPVSWTIVIALPASVYLEGVQSATSQSAAILTWALVLALVVVVLFTSMVTAPVDKMARTARAMADGVLTERVPGSRIHEINVLTQAFNAMEDQILASMDQLRASESQFRDILNGSLEGFYRTTPGGRVLMVNPAMAEILGYGSVERLMTEVQNTGLQIWAQPEDRVNFVSVVSEKGHIRDLEAELVRGDGSLFWGLISARMVHRSPGEEPYLEGFLLDITARKRADLELEQHREHLEVLVERRTQELVEARDAADRASHSKSLFLSNMSHEIRSPMNAVLGFAQLLNHDRTLSEPARTKVRTILNSGENLMSIIDEILEMARIGSGRIEVRQGAFDLRQLVEEVAGLFRLRATEKGLTLHVDLDADLPASLIGDQGKVRQVMTNLVSNAVKYTAQGSVTLKAGFRVGRASVVVEDTGIGLSPEEQAAVFEPFERTAQGEAAAGGTGLGLSICRRYAALLGGTVEVTSQKGVGSRFILEFPAAPAGPLASQTVVLPQFPQLVPGQEGRRLLVVDDLDLNRELLKAFLEPLGLVVDEAPSGQEALARAQANPPSVVLLDLRMPGWNGFETTRRLRALPFGPALTILGVSASAFDKDRKEFLDSGIDGFLAKPFREADLYAILAERAGFRFEDGTVAALRPVESRPSLQGVDAGWVTALQAAVSEGSPSHIKALVGRLDADHEDLRLWLTEKVGRYDLEAIQRLFDPRGT